VRKIVSWNEFLKVMEGLGYSQRKPSQTGGSAVPFVRGEEVRCFHKPHGGAVLRPKTMAKRLGITAEKFMELAQ
jgi:hypothetical protein